MRLTLPASLLLVVVSFTGCVSGPEYTERDRHNERAREPRGPAPCVGAVWEEPRQFPDGRWEPGHWNCPERGERR